MGSDLIYLNRLEWSGFGARSRFKRLSEVSDLLEDPGFCVIDMRNRFSEFLGRGVVPGSMEAAEAKDALGGYREGLTIKVGETAPFEWGWRESHGVVRISALQGVFPYVHQYNATHT